MPLQIIKIARGKYQVVNLNTGKIHAYSTSLKKAKRQVNLINSRSKHLAIHSESHLASNIKGDGIFDVAKSLIDRFSFKKREEGKLPPKARELLDRIKDEPIISLTIIRTPISSYLNQALQLVSGGTWESAVKKANYDQLFHLALLINGKYTLHKTEVSSLENGSQIEQNSQTIPISVPSQLTIGQLINKTLQKIGPKRFSEYDAVNNNCQIFIRDVLQSNDLLTPEASKFILQDAVAIFKNTPGWTERIAKTITDLGARFNRFSEGEGLKPRLLVSLVKNKLKQLKVPYDDVMLSPKKDKKIRIVIDGKKIDFGANNSLTYLEGADDKKRNAHIARHSKIQLKDGTRAIDKLYSPAWLSFNVLW